ncbi:cellulase family glycosylhydrolase [Microbacterium hydrocarbonoxydans]|uniref:cellulase family glycosylhydrolase n=1 Tax=Microbacterium hydrocarbonoxydans TaxID=273678 RepID=UPI003D98A8E0
MKRLHVMLMGAVLALAALISTPVAATAATTGFHVSAGRIYDANGAEFVPQGINHAHAWYPSETDAFAGIRAAGANTVRVVVSGGRYGTTSAAELTTLITKCKENKLVCILENHDTTGYGEDGSAKTLAQAAAYWTSVKSALIGQEKYVMINIGNEPFGNSGYQNWKSDTISAIQTMRAAGLTHTLVADAPNWGQDWSFTMRDNAAAVAAADGNTVFSVHMYGVFDTAAEVRSYIDSFRSRSLPLMVGEFGNLHSDGDPDETTIMSYTRSQGVGVLAWSWSGNSGGVEYLDLVNGFDASSLTPWGQRFINGADGLKARNPQVASVYGSIGGGAGTAPNGYPYCASAASDPDGDGWGWENNASCVVPSGTGTAPNGFPYCASSASDPDGDGWGWENSRSCVVR